MAELMIEAHGLKKRFGSTVALDGLDLEVPTGAILGVLGPNGAGKTTAIRILTTLAAPDAGSARVAGYDVVRHPRAVQRQIGVTAQDATLDEILTGRQNLVMVGRLSGLTRRDARARAETLLGEFDLTDAGDRMLREYSGGMRRRLDLAAGLVTHPPVLFLDEPTTGLDPTSRARMWSVIRELVADGATVLLTTQYLDEADELADRILVVDHGRAIADGTAAELKAETGGARLDIVLSESSAAAARALEPFVAGRVHVSNDGRRLRAPVRERSRARDRDRTGARRRRHRGRRGRGPPALARRRLLRAHRPSGRRGRRPGGGAAMNVVKRRLRDVAVLTGRNLVHISREPMQLSDVTIQPVLFTLLFVYVFGAGVSLPHGGSYTAFAIAGLLALNLTTSSMGTAVGLSTDLSSGVIDRFRTLPMWRPAVLVGRSLADLLTASVCAAIVAATGLAIGWRPEGTVWGAVGGFALFLLFAYAMSWCCACLGILSKGPESAQGDRLRRHLPARVRLQRPRADAAHAEGPARDRRLEPGQRRHRGRPRSLRQSQPLGDDPRLADAAPGRHVARLVVRADHDLRAARVGALSSPHCRVKGVGELSVPLQSVGAITLFVDDPQRSKRFYEDVFGLPVIYEDANSAVFRFENTIVNLLASTEAHGLIDPGDRRRPGGRIAFPALHLGGRHGCGVRAAGRTRRRAAQRPDDREWGKRTACFADPDGHIWEVAQDILRRERAPEPPRGEPERDRGEAEQDSDLGKDGDEVAAVLEQLREGVVRPGVRREVRDHARGVREDLERRHRAAERGQPETEKERDRAGLLLGRDRRSRAARRSPCRRG